MSVIIYPSYKYAQSTKHQSGDNFGIVFPAWSVGGPLLNSSFSTKFRTVSKSALGSTSISPILIAETIKSDYYPLSLSQWSHFTPFRTRVWFYTVILLTFDDLLTWLDEYFFVTVMLLVILKPQSLDRYSVFVYRGLARNRGTEHI